MVICYFVIANNSGVFVTLSHHPDGKYAGKEPVKLFHNVIFIALNKFSQQMQIHRHLSYYINLPKRINKKKYKTIIRIYEIYNPFNCNNNLLETTSIRDCRENRAGLGAYMCIRASLCFSGDFPAHWKDCTGSFM